MIKKSELYEAIKWLVIFGDMVYILFLLYNGIEEGLKDVGSVRSIAPTGMVFLLILNIILLCDLKRKTIKK